VVVAALDAAIDAASRDEPVTAGGSTLEELVADPAAVDPEGTVVERDVIREIDEAVERLPGRQRTMIEHTFGFGGPAESLAEVAGEFHLSPQRTRTIVVDALEKLRRELEALLNVIVNCL
jgi:DNA-directed RNA polymerase sigma subunit (sigma70/sigma32)